MTSNIESSSTVAKAAKLSATPYGRRSVRSRPGAAAVDHIRHVAASGAAVGLDQASSPGEHLGRVCLVQERGTDAVTADGADPMREDEPSFVDFDGRAAVANLDELPGPLRRDDLPASAQASNSSDDSSQMFSLSCRPNIM